MLGVALVFESISWMVSYRALKRDAPGVPVFAALRASRYPSRFVVLLEDTAAIAGIAIALVLGTWLAGRFPQARLDGIASILIGVVLIVAALFLIEKRAACSSVKARRRKRSRAFARYYTGTRS